MTHKEALRLVLEAMEKHGCAYLGHFDEYHSAIEKAKEALAQPEQEPDSDYPEPLANFQEGQWWVNELDKISSHPFSSPMEVTDDLRRAVAVVHHLLNAAREADKKRKPWVSLTDEEIQEGRTVRYSADEEPDPWSFKMGVYLADELLRSKNHD